MYDPRRVYAWDIETLNDPDNGFNGLDPRASRVTEIAVATDESINGGGEVFTGSEQRILTGFRHFVASLHPGLMTDWNATFFDTPFVAHRSKVVDVFTGMILTPQPGLLPKYNPLPTATTPDNPNGGWSATFAANHGTHASLDVSQAYRRYADERDVKWGLKPVCESLGVPMYEIDRTRLHEYTPAQRRRYVLSDAHGTRELALRLLGLDYTPYRDPSR